MKLGDITTRVGARQPLPWCAVCEKPVDRIVMERSEVGMEWRARVYCHGEREDGILTDFDLIRSTGIRAIAFRAPRLAESKP